VNSELVHEPQMLKYMTRFDGVTKQDTPTSDMIWSVRRILQHLSQRTTVRARSMLMTSTTNGVVYFKKDFLKDSDVIEVEIESLVMVKLENTMKFEKIRVRIRLENYVVKFREIESQSNNTPSISCITCFETSRVSNRFMINETYSLHKIEFIFWVRTMPLQSAKGTQK